MVSKSVTIITDTNYLHNEGTESKVTLQGLKRKYPTKSTSLYRRICAPGSSIINLSSPSYVTEKSNAPKKCHSYVILRDVLSFAYTSVSMLEWSDDLGIEKGDGEELKSILRSIKAKMSEIGEVESISTDKHAWCTIQVI